MSISILLFAGFPRLASISAAAISFNNPATFNLYQVANGGSTGDNPDSDSAVINFALDFSGGTAIENILAIILIIAGFFLCFFGARLVKLSIWVFSIFFCGGLVFYAVRAAGHSALDAFIAGLLVGLFVACVLLCLFVFAIVLMGMATGFILWAGFHTLFPDAISNAGGLYTLMVIAIIAGGIVAGIFQHLALAVFTSIIGSFFFSQGIDYYSHTDFNIFDAVHNERTCNVGYCFAVAFAFFVMAVLGLLVQEGFTKRLWTGKDKQSCIPCSGCLPLPI